jgi:hypothetical protein
MNAGDLRDALRRIAQTNEKSEREEMEQNTD